MFDTGTVCLGCMNEVGSAAICPICGLLRYKVEQTPYLSMGTELAGKYIIGKLLSAGGDGADYIAWSLTENKKYIVREFFPRSIAERELSGVRVRALSGCENVFRDCSSAFYTLWSKLSKLNGLSALPSVKEVIRERATVYAVSEYIEGISLREYVEKSEKKYIPWDEFRRLFLPVLSTLSALHSADIRHYGLCPDNIIVTEDGRLLLSGFFVEQTRSCVGDLEGVMYEGYSALEQYVTNKLLGPWTDVYSAAAMLFFVLTGEAPESVNLRRRHDSFVLPALIIQSLEHCAVVAMVNALRLLPEERTDTVDSFRRELAGVYRRPVNFISSYFEYEKKENFSDIENDISMFRPRTDDIADASPVAFVASSQIRRAVTDTASSSYARQTPTAAAPLPTASSQARAPVYSSAPSMPAQKPIAPVYNAQPVRQNTAIQQSAAARQNTAFQQNTSIRQNTAVRQGSNAFSVNTMPPAPSAEKKKKSPVTAVLAVVLAVVVLICVFLTFYAFFPDKLSGMFSFLKSGTQQPVEQSTVAEMVIVPNFVGRSSTSLASDAEQRRELNIIFVDEYNITAPIGYIYQQSVPADTQVTKLSDVTVYVSLGPKEIAIPDVIGVDAAQVKLNLEQLGFVCVEASTSNDGTHTEGTVASVVPAVGERWKQGEAVYIYIWDAAPSVTEAQTTTNHFSIWDLF